MHAAVLVGVGLVLMFVPALLRGVRARPSAKSRKEASARANSHSARANGASTSRGGTGGGAGCPRRAPGLTRVFDRLADVSLRHTRLVLAVVGVAGVAALGYGAGVANLLDPVGIDDPSSESVKTTRLIEHTTGMEPGASVVALVPQPGGTHSLRSRRRLAAVVRIMDGSPAVAKVTTFHRDGRAYLSRDGSLTYVTAGFKTASDKHRQDAAEDLAKRLERVPGVKAGGTDLALAQTNHTIQDDLKHAELVAFPILFLLSLWFFRSGVAALLPPVLGGFAIVLTNAGLRVASEITPISALALSLVTALGLGLALDYSLLIVSRFREELAASPEVPRALHRTLTTAGRTVCFSSLTVAVTLASLAVFPQRYFYSMGLGGALVTLLACAAAVLILPALLALLGHRVNALAPAFLQRSQRKTARAATEGGWYRLATFVMRRPVMVALVGAAILIALGVPFKDIKFTAVDSTNLPHTASARQVGDAVSSRFPVDPSRTVYVVTKKTAPRQLRRYRAQLTRAPGAAVVGPTTEIGRGLAVTAVTPREPGVSDSAQALVRHLRAGAPRYVAGIAGQSASFIDLKTSLAHHLPLAVALIVVAIFVALFLMTGSLVLPVKALIMNALTACAALGVMVLVFQDGVLGWAGLESMHAIDVGQPALVLAVGLGLSTDYGVFLLDRIREAYRSGMGNEQAVAFGLERTGRIVTSAALLFCVAIGALVTGRVPGVREVSLGTVAAVLLDATIVRALLVPALMRLLGDLNWWAPAPLRRRRLREARKNPAWLTTPAARSARQIVPAYDLVDTDSRADSISQRVGEESVTDS